MLDLSMPITRSIVKSQIELTNFPFRIAVYETICFPIKNINTFSDDNILALCYSPTFGLEEYELYYVECDYEIQGTNWLRDYKENGSVYGHLFGT